MKFAFCFPIKTLTIALLSLMPPLLLAKTNRWSLISPSGECQLSVELSDEGRLTYQVARAGKVMLQPSPLGIVREDQSFESALRLLRAGSIEERREKYELFAGIAPQVDRKLNQRSLEFRNTNSASLIIDLAASDEGVAFRYQFAGESREARVAQAELTGFQFPADARGWLQPYHAAGPYTPAYEDFSVPSPKSKSLTDSFRFPKE